MEEGLTQIGVGGVLAMMIIREVFNYTGKKKNGRAVYNQGLCDERHKTIERQHADTQANFTRVFAKLDEIRDEVRK